MMTAGGQISGERRRDILDQTGVYEREEDDFYVDPPWCTEALVAAEGARLKPRCWDPACGRGTIPLELRRLGVDPGALGSDKVDRGFGNRFDFLAQQTPVIDGYTSIVSNPPYAAAETFARVALSIAPYVALLVQAKFLYSQARYRFFMEYRPSRIYHLSQRPSMPPGHLLDKIAAKGGKMDFAWVVWDAYDAGKPPLSTRVDWLVKP